jgi:hypothetical protein
MEFATPPTSKVGPGTQLNFELFSPADENRPEQRALIIKGAKRQEERVALLLSEFLKDRSRAMHLIDSYSYDKAKPTNAALSVLKKIRHAELNGKTFTNLQVARKISGCFARAEDKRSILAYFFAKHLRSHPELKAWIRSKSLSKLSRQQEQEFYQFLDDST